MGFDVGAITIAYSKKCYTDFMQGSVLAPILDTDVSRGMWKAGKYQYRTVKANGLKDYDGKFNQDFDSYEVEMHEFAPGRDRKFSASVDSVEEAQSYIEGAEPTMKGINDAMINQALIPEVDTLALSLFANSIPSSNVVTSQSGQGYETDVTHIIGTLNSIKAAITNSGYKGDIIVWMNPDVYANLTTALSVSNVLANPTVVNKVSIGEGENKIEVNTEAIKWNGMILIETVADRLVGKTITLDGHSVGQTRGGIIPYYTDSNYFESAIIAGPAKDTFVFAFKHLIANLFVPVGASVDVTPELQAVNEQLVNSVEFADELFKGQGIYQGADGYQLNGRVIPVFGVIDNHAKNCFLVKKYMASAPVVTPVKATCVTLPYQLNGAKTTTVDVEFRFEELNCSGTVYFESATTGSATVDASETLTVPAANAVDRRPYCTPTVTFGTTAGTSVISVYSDNAKTNKIGEVTVTSLG